MLKLNLKPTHKVIQNYYAALEGQGQLDMYNEGNVAPAFAILLRHCARPFKWTLVEQYPLHREGAILKPDGALLDQFKLLHGLWEAKDGKDDLETEIKKKLARGYPTDNIIFQAPDRAIIYQHGQVQFNESIVSPDYLIQALDCFFFDYRPPEYERWEQAVAEFKEKVPQLGNALTELIEKEQKSNARFAVALDEFTQVCRAALNPNLSRHAVEEMLIQHILTERLFRKVFNNPDFAQRNSIAHEIEKVIAALTSKAFSKDAFLGRLDRFYLAIENTAATITEYTEKQSFLNTVYEQFFQGFSVKVADAMGIVYTPQPVVQFMVNSVEALLRREFSRSLSDAGVHIIDPFVGTGNFIIHLMRRIKKTSLAHKYRGELHCNEVMLLPYYIASMNIEHEFLELTGGYEPFPGICLVDTFELAESRQGRLDFMNAENSERVEKLRRTPLFVCIGNPPYNVGQINENDNNKNRKYEEIDKRVRDTYAKDSKATNKNALSDVYVKAYRWATDKIVENDEGVVAFISNNSFISEYAFDGMRRVLEQEFDQIYILDLGGNVRKNPKLSGTTHNVFGIQVGVSINVLVKKKSRADKAQIFYARLDEFWTRGQKYEFLDGHPDISEIDWRQLTPDANHTWLTEGLRDEFATLIPFGNIGAKAGREHAIAKIFSRGAETTRDAWVYNHSIAQLVEQVKNIIKTYNYELFRWNNRTDKSISLDNFVQNNDKKIKWSSRLKERLLQGQTAEFNKENIRTSVYRPFCKEYLYFDSILTHRQGHFPKIFPTSASEAENRVICVSGIGSSKPFHALMVNQIPCLDMLEKTQCFPFYTYDEDGANRRENISDWALEQFRQRYAIRSTPSRCATNSNTNSSIEKLDIFHYIYALLHHPAYREKYQANLRRELPRIPLAPDFWSFAEAGRKLADLHVNYEQQQEYPLEMIEAPDQPLNWRVEKMRLNKSSRSTLEKCTTTETAEIKYNDFLTLRGIPAAAFDYRLGNRSALEWIVDQYQVKTDKRSGIVNDPNRADEPEYIVKLIKKIVTISMETARIVAALPALE